jgi:FAD/FMN-containing dehydrogenase
MSRFTKISHDKAKRQLIVGAGCVFDEIYKVIRAEKYNIVGGGGSVGLGWLMGGGYSLKTNQYGLGIDNLVQVEIVLPDGKKVKAAENVNSDLFWAIKVCLGLNL